MPPKTKFLVPKCNSPYTDGKTEPIRALPASWYTSDAMFELERRAIFSQKWMLITHEIRLPTPGDWVKFEITGYEYVIARNRKGQIHAFHNTCRHRAYAVVDGKSGHNQILSCKYHGWSYTLDGSLTKAPWYDDMQNFDKRKNGLFKLHVKTDALGFIWVNLDASDTPEPWEDEFDGIDQQSRYNGYNLSEYTFDHEWEIDADTNWKLCSDNFNECYHCPTSHPTIPTLFDIGTLTVDSVDGYVVSNTAQIEEQEKAGLKICTTYYFPNVSTNILPNYIMLQRFLPQSARKTKMHYQIFRHKDATEENFDLINTLYKQVMDEDKGLAVGCQKNMERGLFINGPLHPRVESGTLHVQARTREIVKRHADKEKEIGHQIWPASQTPSASDAASREDEAFCAGLACNVKDNSVLAW